ncbi:hypothetical protein M422DRAFT_780118 [Sphaerobolus stellatus SS14]|uniref:Uncharacterized protein n=1 Tax=Sphaerobolus stellatus (strain SS14) TaxID=990650 RepID=A0A0C9VUC7_SPHS4|nr:hypothetical protein M422DRAFT_780118 [Sphaerobolus stellatus SS14]
MPLSVFALPLPPNGPPSGYGWEERDASALSTTTAFHSVIDRRDIFLGQHRCIVCGMDQIVGLPLPELPRQTPLGALFSLARSEQIPPVEVSASPAPRGSSDPLLLTRQLRRRHFPPQTAPSRPPTSLAASSACPQRTSAHIPPRKLYSFARTALLSPLWDWGWVGWTTAVACARATMTQEPETVWSRRLPEPTLDQEQKSQPQSGARAQGSGSTPTADQTLSLASSPIPSSSAVTTLLPVLPSSHASAYHRLINHSTLLLAPPSALLLDLSPSPPSTNSKHLSFCSCSDLLMNLISDFGTLRTTLDVGVCASYVLHCLVINLTTTLTDLFIELCTFLRTIAAIHFKHLTCLHLFTSFLSFIHPMQHSASLLPNPWMHPSSPIPHPVPPFHSFISTSHLGRRYWRLGFVGEHAGEILADMSDDSVVLRRKLTALFFLLFVSSLCEIGEKQQDESRALVVFLLLVSSTYQSSKCLMRMLNTSTTHNVPYDSITSTSTSILSLLILAYRDSRIPDGRRRWEQQERRYGVERFGVDLEECCSAVVGVGVGGGRLAGREDCY